MGRKYSLDCFIITALAVMELVGMDVGALCLGGVPTQVPAEGPGPPGCRWPLLGRPRPQTGRGQPPPWLSAQRIQQDRGAFPLLELAGLGKGPKCGQTGPFSEHLGAPGAWGRGQWPSSPRQPQGLQVLKKVGEATGHWVPLRWTCWEGNTPQRALLMEPAPRAVGSTAKAEDTAPRPQGRAPRWQSVPRTVGSVS